MPFVYRTVVRDDDIDDLGHANNLVYVRWVLEAAVAHSQAAGFGARAYLERGQVFVVRRHELEYLRPAFAGDALEIETRVTAFSAATSQRSTVIRRERDGGLLAAGRTTWAYLVQASGRPTRIPDDLRGAMPAESPSPEWLKVFGE
jgi:acyl-CoA thioester hydrolase